MKRCILNVYRKSSHHETHKRTSVLKTEKKHSSIWL